MEKISKYEKLLWIGLIIAYFISFYFLIPKFSYGKTLSISTLIDEKIPFTPFFIIFYIMGYVFAFLPAFWIGSRKLFFKVVKAYFLVMTVSFMLFAIVPAPLNKELASGSDLFSKLTLTVQKIDTSFNTFPSLHVSLNMLSFLFIRKINRKLSYPFLYILILIILSTLFVKQHYIADVIGGIALSLLAYSFYKVSIQDVSQNVPVIKPVARSSADDE